VIAPPAAAAAGRIGQQRRDERPRLVANHIPVTHTADVYTTTDLNPRTLHRVQETRPSGQPYQDVGGDYFVRRVDPEARTRQLVAQLEQLGHKVILAPAA
jgi:hypothetical protein